MKSIMGVLSLAVPANSFFKVSVNGPDEEEAAKAIARTISDINELK